MIKLLNSNKCLKLADFCNWLNYSESSVKRLLKSSGYYSSFTHNGKWYTLQTVPEFDLNGLWFHHGIGFSMRKDINTTILYLIGKSKAGLTGTDLSEILSTSCPPILNRLYKTRRIDRLKISRCYVYLSTDAVIRRKQISNIESAQCLKLPSDSDTIYILVELIRNPNCSFEELSLSLGRKEIFCSGTIIRNMFVHYELEKKTPKLSGTSSKRI